MAFVPGTLTLLYSAISNPASNTIAATTTETSFFSQCPIPANTLSPGDLIIINFSGIYSTPGLAPPTTIAKVKLSPSNGATPTGAVTVLATPALSNPAGASGLGYSGQVFINVLSAGAAGSLETSGVLIFNSSTTASVTVNIPAVNTTVNMAQLNYIQLAVLFSAATAGNSNTLNQLIVTNAKAVPASN